MRRGWVQAAVLGFGAVSFAIWIGMAAVYWHLRAQAEAVEAERASGQRVCRAAMESVQGCAPVKRCLARADSWESASECVNNLKGDER